MTSSPMPAESAAPDAGMPPAAPGANGISLPTWELGEEVTIPEIPRRLKALWEDNEARTRASLMNFAICSERPDALAENTEIIRELTREHACRALLVAVEPAADSPSVRAWVTAHCQLGDGGHKSVCSEQLSFLIRGCGYNVVANTIFAHVDSDLPLTLWWQGDFSGNWEPHLFTEIDRLVLDSSEWRDPLPQFDILQRSWRQAAGEFSVNDLAWTRVLHLRMALAACFDDPAALALLPHAEEMTISCARGHALAGRMFAAWAMHRAGMSLSVGNGDGAFVFQSSAGQKLRVLFAARESDVAVPSVTLRGPGLQVSLTQEDCGKFIQSRVETPTGIVERLTPSPCHTPAELVIERLRRGCNTKLYFTLLETVRAML
jgi:glucose-6-phosphate dehydrogenase assembly protein OpcA